MKTEGTRLREMREGEARTHARARMRALRAEIKDERGKRPARLARIRELCREGRANVRARAKELRAQVLADLRAEISKSRSPQSELCRTRRASERAAIQREIDQRRAELAEARRSYRARFVRERRSRVSRQERAEEKRHEVIANLPPELVPVFERVAKDIKGGPRRTRTEAFLEWAEENPGEVHGILYEQADRDVERMVREHQELERSQRRRA